MERSSDSENAENEELLEREIESEDDSFLVNKKFLLSNLVFWLN